VYSKEKQERDSIIVKMHNEGCTHKEIGEKYGMTKSRIYQIINRSPEYTMKITKRGISAKEREEKMVALRNKGLSLHAIGKLYGLTRERVRQIIYPQMGLTGRVAVPTVPFIKRDCKFCSKPFKCKEYSQQKFDSQSCATRYRHSLTPPKTPKQLEKIAEKNREKARRYYYDVIKKGKQF
jgi:Mor family transcriptional regulator